MAETATEPRQQWSSTLHAALADAFAAHLRRRLPLLAELAAQLTATSDGAYAAQLAAECHALASGAVLTGEAKAARLAFGCERLLAGCGADRSSPVSPAVTAAVAGRIAALTVLLLARSEDGHLQDVQ